MSIPLLLGSIQTGQSFMIVTIQNGKPMVLNSISKDKNLEYYWEPDLSKASNSFGIFKAIGNSIDSVTIMDTNPNNQGYLGFKSDGVTITNVLSPVSMKFTQSKFSNWYSPDLFLSSVPYSIFNSNGKLANIYLSSSINTTVPANNIIILPVTWYSNCSPESYDIINDPLNSVLNWFCNIDNSISLCQNASIIKSGWTNITDCNHGIFYNYCSLNQYCGDSGCNGPCRNSYDDCIFLKVLNNFTCVLDPKKFFTETKWWLNPYFLGIVGTIVIIIIGIIIILIIIVYKLRKK